MRHYLTMKSGSIPDERKIYKEFKKHARNTDADMYKLVADMHEFAGYYCAVVSGQGAGRDAGQGIP